MIKKAKKTKTVKNSDNQPQKASKIKKAKKTVKKPSPLKQIAVKAKEVKQAGGKTKTANVKKTAKPKVLKSAKISKTLKTLKKAEKPKVTPGIKKLKKTKPLVQIKGIKIKEAVSKSQETVKKVQAKDAVQKKDRTTSSAGKTKEIKMATPKKNEIKKAQKVQRTPKIKTKQAKTKNKSARLGPISELKYLFANKNKNKKDPVVIQNLAHEQVIEKSKFFVSPSPGETAVWENEFSELPAGYGDNRIVIQVRDPHWLHAYWEITQSKLNLVYQEFNGALEYSRRVLRVYDITGRHFNGSNANNFWDIDINDFANSWYINTANPGRSFCVDIGFCLRDGRFIMLARSNFVSTPIDGPSWITDEEWMIVEDDFNKLYGLSAGLGVGLSSADIRRQIIQKISNVSSGELSSPGVSKKAQKRKFWLKVNTELIVYGATEPDAEVTVQGRPIQLNKDGTFSLRFALPDGKQTIPVKAVSKDKIDTREITPIVKKETK